MRGFGPFKRREDGQALVPAGAGRGRARPTSRDREFLPAALEIIEAPPSPIRSALLLVICLLVAAVLAWSCIGRIDIVSIAAGKIQPEGRVKTIQSVETGRVIRIAAVNGTHVSAGSILFVLDPAEGDAEDAELATSATAFRAEALRRAAAVEAARSASFPRIDWPADIPAEIRKREEGVLASQLDALRADVKNLEAQVVEKTAERVRLQQTAAAQAALVATLKERVDMRTTLMSSGAGPRAAVLDAQENYQTQAANLAYQTGQIAENDAAVAVAQSAIEKSFTTFIADNDAKRGDAERQADDYARRLQKARVKSANMVVTSPVAGIVQGSTVTTDGQVVNTGEEVMRIVPDGAVLEVEAYLENKDVGFVAPGQEAVIKVESFPFTRYGTVTGKVVRVATDAIAEPDVEQSEAAPAKAIRDLGIAGGQHMRSLVFPVTIALARPVIEVDGRDVALSPGMAVSAEVKTGTRRLIDYLLSPVIEVSATAMRER